MHDDTIEIRPPESNAELISRIATRREEHEQFRANVARSVHRAAAESQFRNTVAVLRSMSYSQWSAVMHGMITAAVSDLLQALEATSPEPGDAADVPAGRRELRRVQ